MVEYQGGIVENCIKGSMKSPCLPSRSPQPQPKKNLIAFRGILFYFKELWKEKIVIEVCMDGQKLAIVKD